MQFLVCRYPQGSRIQASTNPTFQKSQNLKIQKSDEKKIQKPKNPKIENVLHLRNLAIVFGFLDFWVFGVWDFWIFGFLDFWVFGFLDFWIFCVLHLCVQSVETAPKLDSEKNNGVCIGVYSVFKGCACRGVTMYMHVYVCIETLILSRCQVHLLARGFTLLRAHRGTRHNSRSRPCSTYPKESCIIASRWKTGALLRTASKRWDWKITSQGADSAPLRRQVCQQSGPSQSTATELRPSALET